MNPSQCQSKWVEQPAKAEIALRTFSRLSLDLFCIFRQDGTFEPLSPSWETVLGWTLLELRSRPGSEFVDPEDLAVSLGALSRCTPERLVEYENRYRHQDGSYRWLSWRISQAEDGFVYGVAQDITVARQARAARRDRAREAISIAYSAPHGLEGVSADPLAKALCAEREPSAGRQVEQNLRQAVVELREWQNRYQAVGQVSGQLLYDWNTQTDEVVWGQNVEQVLGYTPDEFKGGVPQWDQLIHPDDFQKILPELARFKVTKEPVHLEYRMRKRDGTYATISDNGRFYPDAAGELNRVMGFIVDISDRKRVEATLQQTLDELETRVEERTAELQRAEAEILKALAKERELSELRSNFVSLVSHEFRTPLTAIQSSAELLERYSDRLSDAKKQTHHQRIQSAVRRMTLLLEDILTVGKANAGKLKFEPGPLNLNAFCGDLVESLRVIVSSKHTLDFSAEVICPDTQMDEKLLGHVLTNLLSNAIKYSPQGGRVHFELTGDSQSATFQIQDRGIGIPQEDLQQLFESFHRARNVGLIPGTGLGLAIVKECVDLQGGQITVESEMGVGTTFKVTLPLNHPLG